METESVNKMHELVRRGRDINLRKSLILCKDGRRIKNWLSEELISQQILLLTFGRKLLEWSVGKTMMNEQSSRSHFVFTLRIIGVNEVLLIVPKALLMHFGFDTLVILLDLITHGFSVPLAYEFEFEYRCVLLF